MIPIKKGIIELPKPKYIVSSKEVSPKAGINKINSRPDIEKGIASVIHNITTNNSILNALLPSMFRPNFSKICIEFTIIIRATAKMKKIKFFLDFNTITV